MGYTSTEKIPQILKSQRSFFSTNKTKDVDFRLKALKKLKAVILKNEKKISEALWKDLHKSEEEVYLTEISIVLSEIDLHIKNLKRWAKPQKVKTPLVFKPAKSMIVFEPLGVALIITPWNYPFQLMMSPLMGVISSGCCGVLKPSEYAENIALVMEDIIREAFDPSYIDIVQGDRKVSQILLKQRFDMIFFTGSTAVGKMVMKAAAENLTPVVLELGGKSPCIVDKDANLDIAAKRIAWGKTMNAGQTCIAPDYLFAHRSIKDELIKKIGDSIEKMFGSDIQASKHFVRIINTASFDKIAALIKDGDVKFGGKTDREDRFISPTIIDNVKPGHPVMQEEIFGPVLPVMTFDKTDEVISYVNSHEKPLALYYFGSNKGAGDMLSKTSSGGACINDTIIHFANLKLPFGGVGNSGIGNYHGHESFLAFSNKRAVVKNPTWIDLPMKYVPYKNFKLVKKLL